MMLEKTGETLQDLTRAHVITVMWWTGFGEGYRTARSCRDAGWAASLWREGPESALMDGFRHGWREGEK